VHQDVQGDRETAAAVHVTDIVTEPLWSQGGRNGHWATSVRSSRRDCCDHRGRPLD
jgi:hypothetical protein